jgi:hypothetical protein
MNRRHITPVKSFPGSLDGYRLAFTLGGPMRAMEPRFANIEEEANAVVHGVLHLITVDHMKQLVREEGGGQSYKRLELPCKSYTGDLIKASAFVCPLDNKARVSEAAPSIRYLGLLIDGATETGLAASYIEKLKAITPAPLAVLKVTDEMLKQINGRAIPMSEVIDKTTGKKLLAVKGVVLDMTSDSTFFSNIFAYRDCTLQIATFACCKILLEPKQVSDFTDHHKKYVNAMLAMVAEIFPIVGHVQEQPYSSYNF